MIEDFKNSGLYVNINGVSGSKKDDLLILFLKDGVPLSRGAGAVGVDMNHLFEKSIEAGEWETPLDLNHEIANKIKDGAEVEDAIKSSEILGRCVSWFKVPYNYNGFININGEPEDISRSEEDKQERTQNKLDVYYGVYKLTNAGIALKRRIKEQGGQLQASTTYDWDGSPLNNRDIDNIKIIDKIKPISNSIIMSTAEKKHSPAINIDANNLSINEEKKTLDFIKVTTTPPAVYMAQGQDIKSSENGCISKNDVAFDLIKETYIRPDLKIVIPLLNGATVEGVKLMVRIAKLDDNKVRAINKFIDAGCVCNIAKNEAEEEKEEAKNENEESKEVGFDIKKEIEELKQQREADKLEIIELIKGLYKKEDEENKEVADNEEKENKEGKKEAEKGNKDMSVNSCEEIELMF